jgi:hypothetical protein
MVERLLTGACNPGLEHVAEPVTTLDGETVGHICRHCLVRLRFVLSACGCHEDHWQPYSDTGEPLPMLPDPGRLAHG